MEKREHIFFFFKPPFGSICEGTFDSIDFTKNKSRRGKSFCRSNSSIYFGFDSRTSQSRGSNFKKSKTSMSGSLKLNRATNSSQISTINSCMAFTRVFMSFKQKITTVSGAIQYSLYGTYITLTMLFQSSTM